MATIHGQAGSVTALVNVLQGTSYTITSLQDIADFERNYQKQYDALNEKSKRDLAKSTAELESTIAEKTTEYTQRIADKTIELREELETLKKELPLLRVVEENFFKNLYNKIKHYFANTRKIYLDGHIDNEAKRIYRHLELEIFDFQKELDDKKNNTDAWIETLTKQYTAELQWVQKKIKDNTQLLLGAEGEQKAIDTLATLPEEYTILNDYVRKFYKPFHNKENDDWIYSVQIDHLVIGPTGLCIIETKNWSGASQQNTELFSPIEQLKRFGFVMYVLLNQAVTRGDLPTFRINITMIPRVIHPKNILLLMNHKPPDPFEHVTALTLNDITDHITRGEVIFSKEDCESLTTFLLNKDTAAGYQSI